MNTYLKSGFAAAVVGLGIFATAGSAYAAGCVSPDQNIYSLADETDTAKDALFDANTKGFRCDTVASDYSVVQPSALLAQPQAATPAIALDNAGVSLSED